MTDHVIVLICRDDQFDDDDASWNFEIGTVRESKPATRGLVPNMAEFPPPMAPTPEQPLNYAEKMPASSAIGGNFRQLEQEVEEEKRVGEGKRGEESKEDESLLQNSAGSNRLSNGLDSKSTSDSMTVLPNHSPRSSSLSQDIRLSTLSTDLNPSLPNGLGNSAEQEVATTGESSREVVVEDSMGINRHESISEHTRELDEFLSRSSVVGDSRPNSILCPEEFETFETIGSGSDEDVEGGNRRSDTVRREGRGEGGQTHSHSQSV